MKKCVQKENALKGQSWKRYKIIRQEKKIRRDKCEIELCDAAHSV